MVGIGVSILLVASSALMYAQSDPCPPIDKVAREQARLLRDWPQLNRYRQENAAFKPPRQDEKRVVFFGSSTTDNWGRKYDSVFFPGKPYLNRGIGGQTTPQMLIRFQQDVVALHPAIVVILGGSNDIAGNTGPSTLEMIENNLSSMVAIAKANRIKVILASQLPTLEYPWMKGTHPAPELLALTAWERDFAQSQGLGFVDYYSVLVGPDGGPQEGLSVDGLHPTAKGYALMAPLVEKVIDQLLLEK